MTMRTAQTATGFAKTVAAFAASARRNASTAAQNTAARLGETIINATPVRTGQARAGWMPSTGSPASGPPATPPASPPVTQAVTQAASQAAQPAASARPSNTDAIAARAAKESLDRLNALDWNPETGASFFLTNAVPHIRYLEYGGSASAPSGMVRLAAASFKTVAAEEAARAKTGMAAASRSAS